MKHLHAALAATAVTLALCAAPAAAETGRNSFDINVSATAWGKSVAVRYHHTLLGWIDAGRVEFHDDGRIVVHPRGGSPAEVGNLAETLTGYAADKLGNPALGRQLAQVIERQVGR